MSVIERMGEPTPKFFRVLRTIGLSLVAAGGAVVTEPIAVPAMVLTIAGYLMVAGTVMTAVSQAAVEKLEE
jgi:hypothetical protein